jgi:hypothetical protein
MRRSAAKVAPMNTRETLLRRMAQAAREYRAYNSARGILPRARVEIGMRLALNRLGKAANLLRGIGR